MDTIPLYVRSGSIVPIGPGIIYADEKSNAPLELRIYPGQNGKFTLYGDEGDNYNYEQGISSTILLSWDDTARRLTVHARQGNYPGMPASREFHIVTADGSIYTSTTAVRNLLYVGEEIAIYL